MIEKIAIDLVVQMTETNLKRLFMKEVRYICEEDYV